MVGPERLELSHIAALDPKSSASTNFATGPRFFVKKLSKKLLEYWPFANEKQINVFGGHSYVKFTLTKLVCQDKKSCLVNFL